MSGTGSHRGFGFVDFLTKQDAKGGGCFALAGGEAALCRTENERFPLSAVSVSARQPPSASRSLSTDAS
ncbi:hypothetical protein GN956_G26859 [Arapaima gigas]